jgi:hypothetical protein
MYSAHDCARTRDQGIAMPKQPLPADKISMTLQRIAAWRADPT